MFRYSHLSKLVLDPGLMKALVPDPIAREQWGALVSVGAIKAKS